MRTFGFEKGGLFCFGKNGTPTNNQICPNKTGRFRLGQGTSLRAGGRAYRHGCAGRVGGGERWDGRWDVSEVLFLFWWVLGAR